MNVAKTQLMTMCRQGKQEETEKVKVRIEFPKQEVVKYLGVTVDKELNWKQHIYRVYNKSLGCLASIRRTGTYCSVVWNSCGAGQI